MNLQDTRYPPIGSLGIGQSHSLSGITPRAEALKSQLVRVAREVQFLSAKEGEFLRGCAALGAAQAA
jgi:hypothetical protein